MNEQRRIRLGFALPHLEVGGIERVVVNLLKGIDRRRFETSLFLTRREGSLLGEVPEHVRVVDFHGRRSALLPLMLARALRDRRIDVVYSGTNAMNLTALAASRIIPARERPRFLVTEHTSAAEYLAEAKLPLVRRLLLRRLYGYADVLLAPVEEVAAGWRDLVGHDDLVTAALPNPVLEDCRQPPMARPSDRGGPRVAAAGRLVHAKGFDLLIEAFAGLARECPGAELTIWGEGPLRTELAARIAAAGLDGRVRLAGHAPDLVAALAEADLFVLSSRREGFGNVVVEALAAGVPVVATDCAGPRRILLEGAVGAIIPPGDAAALGRAMRSFARDPEPYRQRRERGRQRALDFTQERIVRQFEDLVANLAKGAPPAATGAGPAESRRT
jgi:glycosyltransferase involved in cell wall biosynthesis